MALPDLDAAGIDELWGKPLCGRQQPPDERLELLRFLLLQRLHDVMVVAHEDVKTLVDAGRVLKLLVRVAGAERRNRGVERSRISHTGILVAGGKRAGHAAHRAAVRERCAVEHLAFAFLLGPHFASHVHLGAGDVAVHVDAARHHDHAASIDLAIGANGRIARRGDDLAVGNPQIAHFAIDAVGRVVKRALRDLG